jgi:hypothetical protein
VIGTGSTVPVRTMWLLTIAWTVKPAIVHLLELRSRKIQVIGPNFPKALLDPIGKSVDHLSRKIAVACRSFIENASSVHPGHSSLGLARTGFSRIPDSG